MEKKKSILTCKIANVLIVNDLQKGRKMNICEIILCAIVGPAAIWALYQQAKMTDGVKKQDQKRGMR